MENKCFIISVGVSQLGILLLLSAAIVVPLVDLDAAQIEAQGQVFCFGDVPVRRFLKFVL